MTNHVLKIGASGMYCPAGARGRERKPDYIAKEKAMVGHVDNGEPATMYTLIKKYILTKSTAYRWKNLKNLVLCDRSQITDAETPWNNAIRNVGPSQVRDV